MNDQQQAIEDYRLKLILENKLAIKMRKIFKDMASEIRSHYISRNELPPIDHYDNEIQSTLLAHYREVGKEFKKRLRLTIEKSMWSFDTKALEDDIDAMIALYGRKRSITQTNFIKRTNLKEIENAFSKALISSIVSGVFATPAEIADEASILFERRAMGRASTIGLTETQNMAEATKDIEAQGILNGDITAGGVVLSPDKMTKTWSAILDKVTRHAHMEADDQTVPQDEPFIVMGEKLMFPGDDSLGATPENIMNCRCNSTRAIELAELPAWVYHPENRAPTTRSRDFKPCSCGSKILLAA